MLLLSSTSVELSTIVLLFITYCLWSMQILLIRNRSIDVNVLWLTGPNTNMCSTLQRAKVMASTPIPNPRRLCWLFIYKWQTQVNERVTGCSGWQIIHVYRFVALSPKRTFSLIHCFGSQVWRGMPAMSVIFWQQSFSWKRWRKRLFYPKGSNALSFYLVWVFIKVTWLLRVWCEQNNYW